jgi:putative ABC transport system substrate-binding protein
MTSFFQYILLRAGAAFTAVAALACLIAGHPLPAEANEVIVVSSGDLKPYRDVLRGFKDACDCDVRVLKFRGGEGLDSALEDSPAAVVAVGTAAFRKVGTIRKPPVVHIMAVPSQTALSRNRNISGVSMDLSPETYLAAMTEVFPKAKRIGLLYDPRHTAAFVKDAVKAAQAAGLELAAVPVHEPASVPAALADLPGNLDVFWMLPDPTVVTTEMVKFLLLYSFRSNVPVFSFSKKYAEMGAVASLDVDPYDMGAQAAELVSRLSAGQAGPIRVYARKAHLSINTKVAAKMGLRVRDDLSMKVTKVE